MPDTVVFHHPLPLGDAPTAGSQVRPVRMLEALRGLGYEVVVVAGHSAERAAAAARVREDLVAGRRFAFAYAESSNTPNALNDPDHLPRRPHLDRGFLRSLQRAGVPVGLFYRDVYWRFAVYRDQVPLLKRLPAVALYRDDWRGYRKAVSHLFLPSDRMASALPSPWPAARRSALPPGCVPEDLERVPTPPGWLRLLYVGAVQPPLYDLTPLLTAVRATPAAELTICCREVERPALDAYGPLGDRVRVVHESGDGLRALYAEADAAALVLAPHPYRDFAMPVKLFEALGYGMPVLATSGTSAGDFVAEQGIGVAVANTEVAAVLGRWAAEPAELEALRAAVRAARQGHTWARRAEEVRDTLLRAGSPGRPT